MDSRVVGELCVEERHFGFVVDEALGFGERSEVVGSSGHSCCVGFCC